MLSATLCVGDFISYKTESGEMYEQIVDSMEINRKPVFKAGRGKEAGLKLAAAARIGSAVAKI